ncbi:hypothetical protein BDM02DRAFT_1857438 [Thelephora ganbajun]|uniref:Uncharacterized protein n=1 Tax=Thelephora ganbajun TaxID=370292 RepID=A0ACB6YZF1_THEGA|nr:hypothetical protein BDM02DRAFT_1857438 [Thelephora ganbajun]
MLYIRTDHVCSCLVSLGHYLSLSRHVFGPVYKPTLYYLYFLRFDIHWRSFPLYSHSLLMWLPKRVLLDSLLVWHSLKTMLSPHVL